MNDSPPWGDKHPDPAVKIMPPVKPKMGEMIVVNKKNHKSSSNDFYCGRGSHLGNVFDFRSGNHPQVIKIVKNRAEAISSYEEYLRKKVEEKDKDICGALNSIYRMLKKGDVNLVCYCSPEPCHAEIVKKIIEEKL